uniref:Uncharacterized protein n=1 Tax=Chrysotila carterae TaxID=13221 RepID=A0A7S4BBP5_CHRCT
MWQLEFVGSVFFAVVIFVLAMVIPTTPAAADFEHEPVQGVSPRVLLMWLLVTPVQFGFGWQFFMRAGWVDNFIGRHRADLTTQRPRNLTSTWPRVAGVNHALLSGSLGHCQRFSCGL